jgi:hypothetical protein
MARLTLKAGQTQLTPAQQAKVDQFLAARMQGQLATDPIDEDAAEALLCRAYEAVKLTPPERVLWVDSPLAMVALLTENSEICFVDEVYRERISGWAWDAVHQSAEIASLNLETLRSGADYQIRDVVRRVPWTSGNWVAHSFASRVRSAVEQTMREQTALPLQQALEGDAHWPSGIRRGWHEWYEEHVLWMSVSAFTDAAYLTYCRFLHDFVAPNHARWLAQFNELVSGYWCGATLAIVVRHPKQYVRDAEGRLHSASGRCLTASSCLLTSFSELTV